MSKLYLSDTWEMMAKMPQDRDYVGCVQISNTDNFLVVGRFGSHNAPGDR